SIICFSLLLSIETIIPMYIQIGQKFSALFAGITVIPGAISLAIMSLLGGRLYDKYGGKLVTIIGFILLIISTLSFYLILNLDTSLILTSFLFVLAMCGVGMINMPTVTFALDAIQDNLIPHGTAVVNVSRQLGASLGL